MHAHREEATVTRPKRDASCARGWRAGKGLTPAFRYRTKGKGGMSVSAESADAWQHAQRQRHQPAHTDADKLSSFRCRHATLCGLWCTRYATSNIGQAECFQKKLNRRVPYAAACLDRAAGLITCVRHAMQAGPRIIRARPTCLPASLHIRRLAEGSFDPTRRPLVHPSWLDHRIAQKVPYRLRHALCQRESSSEVRLHAGCVGGCTPQPAIRSLDSSVQDCF